MTAHRSIFLSIYRAAFITSVLAASLVAGQAAAQATNGKINGMKLSSDQPIQIESDQLEIHDQEKTALFTGKVKVVQGTTTLEAGKMTVFYKDKQAAPAKDGAKAPEAAGSQGSIASGDADIDHILVSDNVFLNSGTQTATAENGEFNMAEQTFILKGQKVVLTDGPNVFTGCQLTVHMATGEAKLDSCGGRVQIQLDPKSQKTN